MSPLSSLRLTLSLRHSPIVTSCSVITLLITMLWDLGSVVTNRKIQPNTENIWFLRMKIF